MVCQPFKTNSLSVKSQIAVHFWELTNSCLAGWWFGVVGHLESCSGSKLHCKCYTSGEDNTLKLADFLVSSFS